LPPFANKILMNLLFLALKTLKWLLILTVLLTLTVTAYIHFHPTFGGKPVKTKGYLLIGSINGNTIIAQSLNLNDKEPPSEIITEIFKAQVEKLKG